MLKNWKKIIAMFLIFTITFGDFALVGKAYATSIFDGIFKEEQDAGDTGSANVEFLIMKMMKIHQLNQISKMTN